MALSMKFRSLLACLALWFCGCAVCSYFDIVPPDVVPPMELAAMPSVLNPSTATVLVPVSASASASAHFPSASSHPLSAGGQPPTPPPPYSPTSRSPPLAPESQGRSKAVSWRRDLIHTVPSKASLLYLRRAHNPRFWKAEAVSEADAVRRRDLCSCSCLVTELVAHVAAGWAVCGGELCRHATISTWPARPWRFYLFARRQMKATSAKIAIKM